ncbi:MAG: hypothetical protein HYZ68_03425, partial [Chloroflexi bacterium]|nr:hypothetical protein [Chloroflexota bacterium]
MDDAQLEAPTLEKAPGFVARRWPPLRRLLRPLRLPSLAIATALMVGALFIIVTDEEDCAVKDYAYFDPTKVNDPMYNQYWEDAPGMPG